MATLVYRRVILQDLLYWTGMNCGHGRLVRPSHTILLPSCRLSEGQPWFTALFLSWTSWWRTTAIVSQATFAEMPQDSCFVLWEYQLEAHFTGWSMWLMQLNLEICGKFHMLNVYVHSQKKLTWNLENVCFEHATTYKTSTIHHLFGFYSFIPAVSFR